MNFSHLWRIFPAVSDFRSGAQKKTASALKAIFLISVMFEKGRICAPDLVFDPTLAGWSVRS